MKSNTRNITFFVLLLGLATLACSLTGGGGEPTAEVAQPTATQPPVAPTAAEQVAAPTAEPPATSAPEPAATTAPTPTEAPTATSEAETLDVGQLGSGTTALDSYRMLLSMSFDGKKEDDTPVQGSVEGEVIAVKEPPASSLNFTINGDIAGTSGEVPQQFTVAQIGDTVHAQVPGLGCFSGSSSDMSDMTASFDDIANPDSLISELSEASFVGVQDHNGYRSRCYAFDETSLEPSPDNPDTLDGLVCFSEELGHMTYMHAEALGSEDSFTSDGSSAYGTTIIEFNITDVNQPLEVVVPEGCGGEAGDVGYPVMEDAHDISQFGGLVTYTSDQAFADVLAFYRQEMDAAGYTLSNELVFADQSTAILNYERGEEKLTVTLGPATPGPGTQVLIAPEQ